MALLPLVVATPALNPTVSPSSTPTESPTKTPTSAPTLSPTSNPTHSPIIASMAPISFTPTRAPALTKTVVYVNITQIYDNVGAGDMSNSLLSQTIAIEVLSIALPGIPVGDIRIPKLHSVALKQTAVVFEILGRLEQLGFNNTATFSFMVWLRRSVNTYVTSGLYTSNLKTTGASAGINVFSKAKLSSSPSYGAPQTVYMETYAPTTVPSSIPTVLPTWGGPNTGRCSDRVYYNCMENVAAHKGDFAICDMCMCSDYPAYNEGQKDCGADAVLHACYLSDSMCKYQLRLSWVIGFSFIGAVYFGACCLCLYMCWYKYSKEKRVAHYRPSHRRIHHY